MKWEYKVEDIKFVDTPEGLEFLAGELDKIGRDGWELVAKENARELSAPWGLCATRCTFKRPKNEDQGNPSAAFWRHWIESGSRT